MGSHVYIVRDGCIYFDVQFGLNYIEVKIVESLQLWLIVS